MSSTRSFNSLGVVAKDAIPVTNDSDPDRVEGIAYRKTDVTEFQQEEGELYNVPPATEMINQKLFNQSSYTNLMDTHGIVGWTKLVDYSPPSIVWASDGFFYTCKQANGVSTIIVDPIVDNQANPSYWVRLDNAGSLRTDLASETLGDEGDRIVGHIEETVQQALDAAYSAITSWQHFKVVFSANIYVVANDPQYPYVFYTQAFNVDSINVITQNPLVDKNVHGVKINFSDELDDINYMSFILTSSNESSGAHLSFTPYIYDKTTTYLKCRYNFVDVRTPLSHRKGFNYKDYLVFAPVQPPDDFYYTCLIGLIVI